MTNPETPKSPEIPGTKYELKTLKTDVSWDYKKFETLSKNSSLKSWLSKILKKESSGIISAFEKDFRKQEQNWITIESIGRLICNYHPDLIGFYRWDLWLPYEDFQTPQNQHKMKNTKFSQLTYEQKMKFMPLYNLLRSYGFNASKISKISSKDIIDKYNNYARVNQKIITDHFNQTVKSNEIAFWYVNLENVLKKNYWLTDTECKKMKEYIELIQKHPEYVWWKFKKQVEQAGSGLWYLIAYLIGAATMILWYYAYQWIFWLKQTEQVASWGTVELANFEECFEILAAKAEYVIKDESGDDGVVNYKEDALKFNEGWPRLLKLGKKWIEGVVNYFEWRSIDMKAKFNVWYKFDAKSAKCSVEKKNWKWIFRVKIKKPTLAIIDEEVEVVRSKREKIVNLNKFDNFELKALEDLRKKTLRKANTEENMRKSKESLRKSMLNVFRTTGFASSWIVIDGKDVQDVVIEYTN